ncbi:MAG: hypothetical protein JNN25_03570 [Candidatus Kapabacteria bacterium]|nr:hypothetical protein [Candidatus Kapabacteria bacterium]
MRNTAWTANALFRAGMALVILTLMSSCFLAHAVAGDDALKRRLEDAREQKNDTAFVLALADQAYSRWLTSPDVGIREAQEAIGIAERVAFPRGKAIALVSLGWCHYVRSEYADAMRAFLQGQALAEQTGDNATLGTILQYKGNLFRRVYKDPERSYREHLRSLALMPSFADSTNRMLLLLDIGIDKRLMKHPAEALEYLNKTIAFFRRHADTANLTVSLGYVGECYALQGQHQKALEYYGQAISFATALGLGRALAFDYGRSASSYNALGQPEKAIAEALKAIPLAKAISTQDMMPEVYMALTEGYRALRKFEQASTYQVLLVEVQDMLYADKIRNTILLQQADFDAQKMDARLKALDNDKQLQRRIAFGLAVLVVLVAVAGMFAWRYARREHRAFMLVEERNRRISQQTQELEALNAQLQAANEEIQRQLKVQSEQAQQLKISQTETHHTNEHLERINEELLRANAERVKQQSALEAMNRELSYKNQALSEAERFRLNMLGIVSHDLKNPISVIIGLTNVLLDDNSTHDPRTQDMLRHINESGERMSGLVRDLLDTAARGAGKMNVQLQPTELKDIVAGVLAHHIHSSERKGQTLIFSPHEEVWVVGDVQRLFQVFDNLIGNAIKYSPIAGTIWITVAHHDGKARFTVRDEGVGFTADDKVRAFGFFQKLSATPTGDEPSSGIGLAIVRQIVDMHNGAVWIESEAGKGAMMVVELPLLEKELEVKKRI